MGEKMEEKEGRKECWEIIVNGAPTDLPDQKAEIVILYINFIPVLKLI